MPLNERKEKILLACVREYIKKGQPVSSLYLSRKYDFNISPAMLRWELLDLEKEGFLIHPYTSSGRIPTEKAYRFFVNYILETEEKILLAKRKLIEDLKNTIFKLNAIDQILRKISNISKSYLLCFDEDYDKIYESSLFEFLKEFDFEQDSEILNFVKLIEKIKQSRQDMLSDLRNNEIAIFIGDELPYFDEEDFSSFSLLGVESFFPKIGKSALLMVGPKRMNYENNLLILKKIKELTA